MPALKQTSDLASGQFQHRSIASEIVGKSTKSRTDPSPASLQNHAPQVGPVIQRKPGEDEELSMQRMPIGNQNNILQAFRPAPGNNIISAPGKPPFIQAKLTVNAPGDQYEQEADAMADKVMRMKEPFTSEAHNDPSAIQRKCAAGAEDKQVHRKENSTPETQGSDDLDNYVGSLGSSGNVMPESSRQFFEPRFGQDFSNVRIHTDSVAAKSAQSINALAYTTGNNIVFNHGQYSPGSASGQRLMAHELTHVVQQGHHNTRAPGSGVHRSIGLNIRDQFRQRSSAPSHFIQRTPVKTWGGEYDTDKYNLVTDPGMDGLEIELKFKPNKYANAEMIGLTQTSVTTIKGSPVPFSMYGPDEEKSRKSRAIPPGKAAEGTFIDRISSYGNPLYATNKPGAKDGLSDTSTTPFWGNHGWYYTDKAGKLQQQDALLKDKPMVPSSLNETGQLFETTALAVKGIQEGTYYGSVQWGWNKNPAGKATPLPLKLISNDVPSGVFSEAAGLWNNAKTSGGDDTIDLPIIEAKYTNTEDARLVDNPSADKSSIIGKLKKNTRLEVIDHGKAKPFNKTADQWWKVTVVEGPYIGKVGWVMQADLSEAVTK